MEPQLKNCWLSRHVVSVDTKDDWPNLLDYGIEGSATIDPSINSQGNFRRYILKAPALRHGEGKPTIGEFQLVFNRHSDDGLKVSVWFECRANDANEDHFYPLDRRMKRTDFINADLYEHNKAGTAWVFKRSTAKQHRDIELEIIGMVRTAFDLYFKQIEYDVLQEITGADLKLLEFIEFYGEVVAKTRELHRARKIGDYALDPFNGLRHETVVDAINAVKDSWTSNSERTEDWQTIHQNVGYILNSLNIPDGKFPWETEDDNDDE